MEENSPIQSLQWAILLLRLPGVSWGRSLWITASSQEPLVNICFLSVRLCHFLYRAQGGRAALLLCVPALSCLAYKAYRRVQSSAVVHALEKGSWQGIRRRKQHSPHRVKSDWTGCCVLCLCRGGFGAGGLPVQLRRDREAVPAAAAVQGEVRGHNQLSVPIVSLFLLLLLECNLYGALYYLFDIFLALLIFNVRLGVFLQSGTAHHYNNLGKKSLINCPSYWISLSILQLQFITTQVSNPY